MATYPNPGGWRPGNPGYPGSPRELPGGGGLLDEILRREGRMDPEARRLLDEIIRRNPYQDPDGGRPGPLTPKGRGMLRKLLGPLGLGLSALGLVEALMQSGLPWTAPAGWVKTTDCGRPVYWQFFHIGGACGVDNSAPIGSGFPAELQDLNPDTVSLYDARYYQQLGDTTRYPLAQHWVNTGTEPWPAGRQAPGSQALNLPAPAAGFGSSPVFNRRLPHPVEVALEPMAQPVNAPAPAPHHIPWAVLPEVKPRPPTAPSEGSSRGNELPEVRPEPKPEPGVSVGPGGVVPTPPVVVRHPPPPGSKERKGKPHPLYGLILRKLVNPVTEALDFIDAFWDALPDQYKDQWRYGNKYFPKAYHSPQRKLELLYENWDKVDLNKAIDNLVKNQIEDYIFGKLGSKLGDASRQHNRPIGFGAGPAL